MTTSKSLLTTLDPQQRAAAEAPDGPILIMGGPGTGKTHTLLARVEMLIKKGVPPQSITVVAHDTRIRRGHAPTTCGNSTDRRCSGAGAFQDHGAMRSGKPPSGVASRYLRALARSQDLGTNR